MRDTLITYCKAAITLVALYFLLVCAMGLA